MTPAAIAIPNLLYTYADRMDAGDSAGAARMFRHGGIVSAGNRVAGEEAIVALWQGWTRIYEDRTPRTRHITTNPIIELSADGETATCRSQWTALQATPGYPLQIVATGRYHDRLARIHGEWCFTERDYAQIDLAGDLRAHLLRPLADGED